MLYNKIKGNKPLSEKEKALACSDRNFSAQIFRYVKSVRKCIAEPEQIALKLGYGSDMTCKVRVVLDAFCELGLINLENNVYSAIPDAPKVSLSNSEILKKLGYKEN